MSGLTERLFYLAGPLALASLYDIVYALHSDRKQLWKIYCEFSMSKHKYYMILRTMIAPEGFMLFALHVHAIAVKQL